MADRPIPNAPTDLDTKITAAQAPWIAAQAVADRPAVLGVYAACEWDCLSGDGQSWVKAIVEEARRPFIEALTPSGDTKGAYAGEFKTERGALIDWTAIKEIMAAIRARATAVTSDLAEASAGFAPSSLREGAA